MGGQSLEAAFLSALTSGSVRATDSFPGKGRALVPLLSSSSVETAAQKAPLKQIWLPKMHNSPATVPLPRHAPLPRGWSRLGSSHITGSLPSQLWGVPRSSAGLMAVLCFYLYLQHNQAVPFFSLSIFNYTSHLVRSRQIPPLQSCQQQSNSMLLSMTGCFQMPSLTI